MYRYNLIIERDWRISYELPLAEPKMNSFLLTALPEAVIRRDRWLLPWLYENFINIYSLPNGILMYTGLFLRSTLAREKSLFHYAIPQNTKDPIEFSVASYGRGSHIHDSLLYGYDADRNGFFSIAQVDYYKQEVFYSAEELEEAYRSGYSGSAERGQLLAFCWSMCSARHDMLILLVLKIVFKD